MLEILCKKKSAHIYTQSRPLELLRNVAILQGVYASRDFSQWTWLEWSLFKAASKLRRMNLKTHLYFYSYWGLPSTLIRQKENGGFRKRSSIRRNLKKSPLPRFLVDEKRWKLTELSSNTNQMTGDCCLFKLPRRSVDGKKFEAFSEWNLRFQISSACCWFCLALSFTDDMSRQLVLSFSCIKST